MDSLDFSSLILWLAPLLLFVLLGGLFMLGRYLQSRAQGGLKRLRSQMRRFQAERKQLELAAGAYSVNDPEPYRSQVANLRQRQAILRRQSEQLERQHVVLHQQAASLGANRLLALLGAPYQWYVLCHEIASQEASITRANLLLEQAVQSETLLRGLSWETARQARETTRCQQNVSRALNELRSFDLYGDTFEAAVEQEQQILVALAQIPRAYLEADERTLGEQADKEATARVYEIVRLNRPRLDQLLKDSRAWQTQYQATRSGLKNMRQALDELDQTLSSLPAELDASEAQTRDQQYEMIAQNLQATLARLEVESMALVLQEANKITQFTRQENQAQRAARRELAALETLQQELASGFHEISLQLAVLGAKSIHPIKWETSLEELAQLNRQANKLASSRKPRIPAEVSADLATATQLRSAQNELARRGLEIGQQHADLLALLDSPLIRRANAALPKWLEKTRQLVEQASRFAAENWSRADGMESLPAQVQALAESAARLVLGDLAEPVSELELTAWLNETRQLIQDYSLLRERCEAIRQRLDDLQRSQTLAEEQLGELAKVLSQIQLVVGSNPFLAGRAAQEIERQLGGIQAVQSELAQPQNGSLVKKVRQVGDLASRIDGLGNHWLNQLNKDIQEQAQEMAVELARLDAITRLEDASVAEARRLLAVGSAARNGTAGRSRLDLPELALELKQRSEFWQECLAAQKALENVRQLVDTYAETSYQRQAARELLAQASAWNGTKRSWPPSSATMEAEQKEMDKIEGQLRALQEQGGKAIGLVAQFSNLSTRYQTLAERLRQNAGRAAQEQSQVEDLETSLNDLASPWQERLSEYRDNPEASLEIRALLDSIDQGMKDIRRQYQQGALEYPQVLQALRALQKKVRYYQAALDDEHAIDASGRVTRRRQSERE